MGEKIYVVTEGCYSYYHIITATTDKALAEKAVERFTRKDYWGNEEIPQIEVFDNAELCAKQCWYVDFDKCGNVKAIAETNDSYDYQPQHVGRFSIRTDGSAYTHVCADTKEDAIKIAAEQRAMFLAQKNGL